MVSQKFIDRIEDLRHNSYSLISKLQTEMCPMVKHIYMNFQFEYWYEGYKYNLWEDHTHLYAVSELPFCYDNQLKNTTFIDTLDNLVEKDICWPFLLFINGIAIQWSKITVIHDYDYTYIKVGDFAPDKSFNATIVYFPISHNKIIYGEDSNVVYGRKGLFFDLEGHRLHDIDFAKLSIRLEILDDDIYFNEVDIDTLVNTIEFKDLPLGYVPSINNILVFDQDGTINYYGGESKFEDNYKGAYGIFDIKETPYYGSPKWAILMYNMNSIKSASYFYDRAEDLDRNSVTNLLTITQKGTEKWEKVIEPLVTPFNLDFQFGRDWETNIDEANKFITRYDYRLWKDAIVKDSPIKSLTYTGSEFKKMASEDGYIHMSRRHSERLEDVVLMFVNSKLYKYSIDITYTATTVNIPIFGIIDEDHIEIIVFTQCNNMILDIYVPGPNVPIYINPEFDLNESYIMGEYCIDPTYGAESWITNFEYNGYNKKLFANDSIKVSELIKYLNISGEEIEEVESEKPECILPYQEDGEWYIKNMSHFNAESNINILIDSTNYNVVIKSNFITVEDPEGRKQYVCTVNKFTVDENNKYTINFGDNYYGMDLKLVPRKQFRHYKFTQNTGQSSIVLPTSFNYCHDPDRYLIFVNGKKIDKTEYSITFMNKDRPFDRLILYISTILDDGDYVDVYYVPEILSEKYKEDSITYKGFLYLQEPNNYPKLYPFSKYTTMVFINGLKVNPLDIKDVDLNAMIINVDKYKRDKNGNIIYDGSGNPITLPNYIDSIDNVTVVEYNNNGSKYPSGTSIDMASLGAFVIDHTLYFVDDFTGVSDRTLIIMTEDEEIAMYFYREGQYIIVTSHCVVLTDTECTVVAPLFNVPTSMGEARETTLKFKDIGSIFDKPVWDSWKLIVEELRLNYGGTSGMEGIESLFGFMHPIESPEPNYKDNYTKLAAILYDAMVENYLTSGATTGDTFVMDYERGQWSPHSIYDEDKEDDPSIIKQVTLYPDHDKLYDYELSGEEASAEDIIEGKKFIPVN